MLEKIQQLRDAGSVPGAEIIVPVPETVNVQVPSVLASAEIPLFSNRRFQLAECQIDEQVVGVGATADDLPDQVDTPDVLD